MLVALGTDMKKSGNVLGAYRTSVHNGRQYIIFKGNHRLRTTIRGTRYRITNPTIVKMGIGTEGLKAAAKGGAYITLIVSVGVNTLAWIFDESFGWKDFNPTLAKILLRPRWLRLRHILQAKASPYLVEEHSYPTEWAQLLGWPQVGG